MQNNTVFIMRCNKKVVLESELENITILSGVHSCAPTDLKVFIFYTQFFMLSELEKVYLKI